MALAGVAGADPRPIRATVVWANGDRAYIAMRDSGDVSRGTLVRILDRDAVIAAGEVADVLEHELAVVRLESTLLPLAHRLTQLRVEIDPPALSRRSRLRVGGPSRAALLFARCDGPVVAMPPGYALDSAAGSIGTRLVRPPDPGSPWPDTLDVVRFEDATDEEIALERGEIDVAVFYPGEPSRHLRQSADTRIVYADRPRVGLLLSWAGIEVTADSVRAATDFEGLAAMNDQLFGGDLSARFTSRQPHRARVQVDSAMPGAGALTAFFRRRADERRVRDPVFRLSRVVLAPGDTATFEARYPVAARADLARDLERLDMSALAALFVCTPP